MYGDIKASEDGPLRGEAKELLSQRPKDDRSPQDDPDFTACHNVFDIPELAEPNFLELGMRDLLCGVIQTSKHFKLIVDTSTKLQQALFFEPIPTKFVKYRTHDSIWTSVDGDMEVEEVYEHPLITKYHKYHEFDAPELDWAAICRPEATWRSALISQPPASFIKMHDGERTISDSGGVRMGQLPGKKFKLRNMDSDPFSIMAGWSYWKRYERYSQLKVPMRNPALKRTT